MTTVSDYIERLEDDDLTFVRMAHGITSGGVGKAIGTMVAEVGRDDDPIQSIDFNALMRNVQRTFER